MLTWMSSGAALAGSCVKMYTFASEQAAAISPLEKTQVLHTDDVGTGKKSATYSNNNNNLKILSNFRLENFYLFRLAREQRVELMLKLINIFPSDSNVCANRTNSHLRYQRRGGQCVHQMQPIRSPDFWSPVNRCNRRPRSGRQPHSPCLPRSWS